MSLSNRVAQRPSYAYSWEELWEAGSYYERVSTLLESSQHSVIFSGWQIDSRLRFWDEPFKAKVIRNCNEKPNLQIYFLMWDHAYIYVLERELWQGRIWESIHPRVHFVFDNRHPLGASHHEKLVLFDGHTALCGGIDVCGERWDSPIHLYENPQRSLDGLKEQHGPYHDLAVQVTGPVCGDFHAHLQKRWKALSSVPFPVSPYEGKTLGDRGLQVYVSRTICEIERPKKAWITREVEFLFRDLIQAAQHRIILEGQYYWSKTLHDLLLGKILQMKGKEFEVILILADLEGIRSFTRFMMDYELRLLENLQGVARFAGVRLLMGAPYVYSAQGRPKPVYIHSKTLVIDDRFLAVGSTNFATRALRIDTEVHLTFEAKTRSEEAHIRRFSAQLLRHWKIDDVFEGSRGVSEFGIRFRIFQPSLKRNHLSGELQRMRFFPLERFFDPPAHMAFRFKIHWNLGLRLVLLSAVILFFGEFALLPEERGPYLLFWLMGLSWILPVPFVLTVGLSLILFQEQALKICLLAYGLAAVMGYGWGRVYPDGVSQNPSDSVSQEILNRVSTRNFGRLIGVLVDPRISFRSKVIAQGLAFIPVPWFVLGTLIFLAGVLYLGMRVVLPWVSSLNHELAVPLAHYLLLGIGVASIGRLFLKEWKNVS